MGQGTGQRNSSSKKKWAIIIGGAFVLLTCLVNGVQLWTTREELIWIDSLVLKHLVSCTYRGLSCGLDWVDWVPNWIARSSAVDGRSFCFAVLTCLFNRYNFGPQERDSSELTNCLFPTSVDALVDWKHGEKCMVLPTLIDEVARSKFGTFEVVEVPSRKHYIWMIVSNTK